MREDVLAEQEKKIESGVKRCQRRNLAMSALRSAAVLLEGSQGVLSCL
jgi:hypothetical protein